MFAKYFYKPVFVSLLVVPPTMLGHFRASRQTQK